ncbi:MAG: Gfo/Idh/MocA family oxidoreductase [Pseudomonadales bacterium]
MAARSAGRAQEFTDRYGISTVYGSCAEMVASSEVDIVCVGTIKRAHKEHSLLAIESISVMGAY